MWYVYILECEDGSLYTGVTTDLERRLKEHHAKTTHYTGYNPPRRIAHTEQFSTKTEAIEREAQIKGWTRRKKLALITGAYQELRRL